MIVFFVFAGCFQVFNHSPDLLVDFHDQSVVAGQSPLQFLLVWHCHQVVARIAHIVLRGLRLALELVLEGESGMLSGRTTSSGFTLSKSFGAGVIGSCGR